MTMYNLFCYESKVNYYQYLEQIDWPSTLFSTIAILYRLQTVNLHQLIQEVTRGYEPKHNVQFNLYNCLSKFYPALCHHPSAVILSSFFFKKREETFRWRVIIAINVNPIKFMALQTKSQISKFISKIYLEPVVLSNHILNQDLLSDPPMLNNYQLSLSIISVLPSQDMIYAP